MANDRFTSAPRRTGRADFPHPALLKALASGRHRFTAQSIQTQSTQVRVDTLPFGQLVGSLAPPLQMAPEPPLKVLGEMAKLPARIPPAEVIPPAFEVPVQFPDQLPDRPEVLPVTDHFPQAFSFTRHRLLGRVHAQKTFPPVKAGSLKAKGVAQKVQTFPRLAQVHHTGFLAVQSQPQPAF